tara:strand:+ start:1223 stop:1678 length:456 start_codon:yes stop_codon:yes gene_type:complete
MRYFIQLSLVLALTFILSSGTVVDHTSLGGQLSVIVNCNSAPTDLDLNNLKSVLKGEKLRWKDGTKITLAFMKTSTDIGADMSSRIFGMTEKELNRYFLAKVFEGMSSPEFFDSESELLTFVNNTKGAIGVINSEKSKGFKTISIDGKNSF